MPKSHQAHLEWPPSQLIHWGETIATATAEVIRSILENKPHPEMGYRACLGILRLAKTLKTFDEFDFAQSPKVSAVQMHEPAQGGYIERAEPVIFIGDSQPVSFCTTCPHL